MFCSSYKIYIYFVSDFFLKNQGKRQMKLISFMRIIFCVVRSVFLILQAGPVDLFRAFFIIISDCRNAVHVPECFVAIPFNFTFLY